MNELRYLEMNITAHPTALLRPEASRYGCIPIREAVSGASGKLVRVIGLISALRRFPTARGIMQFMTLEDETGLLEGVMLPSAYARADQARTPGPFLITGRLVFKQGASHLNVTQMDPFRSRLHPFRM